MIFQRAASLTFSFFLLCNNRGKLACILYFGIPNNTLCLPSNFYINSCFQMLLVLTAYSQEHLKALNYAYSFFCGGRGWGEGGSIECIMENSKMIKFLKNVLFLFSGGNWPIYTWLRL